MTTARRARREGFWDGEAPAEPLGLLGPGRLSGSAGASPSHGFETPPNLKTLENSRSKFLHGVGPPGRNASQSNRQNNATSKIKASTFLVFIEEMRSLDFRSSTGSRDQVYKTNASYLPAAFRSKSNLRLLRSETVISSVDCLL